MMKTQERQQPNEELQQQNKNDDIFFSALTFYMTHWSFFA